MALDTFKLVDQLFYYGCLMLADGSGKKEDAEFWEDMGLLVNCLLFRSITWIEEACREFNKKFPGQQPLIPKENVNYFFLPKKNNYAFTVEDLELNRKFIGFCINNENSDKWLVQLKEN